MEDGLAAVRAGHGGLAVLMLDLNRFKQVNDTFGHPVGDSLLKSVAARLSGAVRETDTVARLGGDEFAVVLQTFDTVAEAETIALRIKQALTRPFQLEEQTVEIGTSIGIAVAAQDAVDAELLFKQADIALYGAKREGGDRHRFFEPAMERRLAPRAA
jgi:diguanylate cyclase (GGDEF)-like protein